MKRLVVLAIAVLFGVPATALAVWGGTEDVAHPGVGARYFDFDESGTITSDDLLCSGSYAGRSKDGRDVFLTAGHCIPSADLGIAPGELWVSFDRDGRDGVGGALAGGA